MKQCSKDLIAAFAKSYKETGHNRFSANQYMKINDYETAINELVELNVVAQDNYIDAGISFTEEFLNKTNS